MAFGSPQRFPMGKKWMTLKFSNNSFEVVLACKTKLNLCDFITSLTPTWCASFEIFCEFLKCSPDPANQFQKYESNF